MINSFLGSNLCKRFLRNKSHPNPLKIVNISLTRVLINKECPQYIVKPLNACFFFRKSTFTFVWFERTETIMHGEISKDVCVYPDFRILVSFHSILVNNPYLIRLKLI